MVVPFTSRVLNMYKDFMEYYNSLTMGDELYKLAGSFTHVCMNAQPNTELGLHYGIHASGFPQRIAIKYFIDSVQPTDGQSFDKARQQAAAELVATVAMNLLNAFEGDISHFTDTLSTLIDTSTHTTTGGVQ